ncbi:MAG TPA: ParB/RepB/Spo0J family partition protein [Candidatus Paceibacterota bacterium]|jgi:ParB family chromosome partitioning protein|nr:ParB/RepB/Spo0J family partition protein [Candidatus Paceibacterota bacterium]
MLGKGLESLIPQKGDGDEGDNASRPPESQPAPAEPVSMTGAAQPVQSAQPAQPPAVFKETSNVAESVFHIETDKITPNPGQPRRNFDEAALRDLAHSLREFGFLQPLVVTKREKETPNGIDVEYELIAGERRLLAAKMLGLRSVPAIIRNVDLEREKIELAVIENIQRENLNPIETARAFQRLQEEFRMTQREIAAKLGKSREVVANAMRLLDLPEYIRVAVEKGEMSESHARFLIAIEDPAAQKRLFDDILANKLTTRDVRERVGEMTGRRRGRPPKSEQHLPAELRAMQDSLSMDLGAPVEIQKGAAKGSITITFYSEEELRNIIQKLGKEGF